MPTTYQLIASNVLGSNAASVTFSSIPSTYTDLVLRMSLRNTHGTVSSEGRLEVNGITSFIYSYTGLSGNGSTASSNGTTATVRFSEFPITGSTATTNTFSNVEIYIPSYTANINKPFNSFGVDETNAVNAIIKTQAALIQTTAAISSIYIYNLSTFEYVAGSSFNLYGIKKN
jgi:hypothetical protein